MTVNLWLNIEAHDSDIGEPIKLWSDDYSNTSLREVLEILAALARLNNVMGFADNEIETILNRIVEEYFGAEGCTCYPIPVSGMTLVGGQDDCPVHGFTEEEP